MPYFLTSPLPVIFPQGGMNMQYMRIRFALEDADMSYMVSSFMTNLSDMLNFMKNNWEMLADDIENLAVARVRAVLLERDAQDDDDGFLGSHARLDHFLDGGIGDERSHRVVDLSAV